MKCPECMKEGKKSCVMISYSSTTDMGWQPYYDEDGEFHSHNPNWKGRTLSCARGHTWHESYRDQCPSCGEWWKNE